MTVVKVFTEKMIAANKPMIAIRSLKVALNKLSPSSDHLTPVHALLAQVCLLSKNYKAAVQVLDREVLEVEPVVSLPFLFFLSVLVWPALDSPPVFHRGLEFSHWMLCFISTMEEWSTLD